ncbi:MAG TPA: GNAT family N-acetyltransferase [Bacillota bacterium]|nr:GNAT family N-acetyltransferase [Bacillota bacterium]
MIRLERSNLAGLQPLFSEYLKTLTGVTDGFWEANLLNAEHYSIRQSSNDSLIGGFALQKGERLTWFYLKPTYLHRAQGIFQQTLQDFSIKTAYVATADPLLMAMCLDFHHQIKMQAYFFEVDPERLAVAPPYAKECLQQVTAQELDNEPEAKTFYELQPSMLLEGSHRLYRLTAAGEILGYGHIEQLKLLQGWYDVGNLVLPQHRQKGVGRSLLQHLTQQIIAEGNHPIVGCWYYNQLSKRTIESAGFYSRSRLLNVLF